MLPLTHKDRPERLYHCSYCNLQFTMFAEKGPGYVEHVRNCIAKAIETAQRHHGKYRLSTSEPEEPAWKWNRNEWLQVEPSGRRKP